MQKISLIKIWKSFLPIIFVFILVHFLKDLTQDVLKISTPFDLLGNAKEDLSFLPKSLQNIYLYGLGGFSIAVEAFLLIAIPKAWKNKKFTRLDKWVLASVAFLVIFFTTATLLNPRFYMKPEIFKYVIFALLLIYIPLWVPIKLFISSLGKQKAPISTIKDEKIQALMLEKSNVNLPNIKISESDNLFGMMIGIPGKPQLILSRALYEDFKPGEIEYVVLHEVGHYKLWHSVIELIMGMTLFAIGVFLLKKTGGFPGSLVISAIIGFAFGIIMIRLGRLHEYQADDYAARKISNPSDMIRATRKFQKHHGSKCTENKNKLMQFLFYRGNPYENRIKMAKREIERRK